MTHRTTQPTISCKAPRPSLRVYSFLMCAMASSGNKCMYHLQSVDKHLRCGNSMDPSGPRGGHSAGWCPTGVLLRLRPWIQPQPTEVEPLLGQQHTEGHEDMTKVHKKLTHLAYQIWFLVRWRYSGGHQFFSLYSALFGFPRYWRLVVDSSSDG